MAPERSSSGLTASRDSALARPLAERAGWSDVDLRAVDTVRVLAADAVQKKGNGHPGTAMSLAPLAYLLFQQVMRHDPADDQWLGRDRFVLSCGHTSLTLYIQLYLMRLRAGDGGPPGAADLGIGDPRPPRVPAHPRRRDHHRPAGPGHGRLRRDGDGRTPGAGPAGPGRRAGHQPLRPPRVRPGVRRRHDGGRLLRGRVAHAATSSSATSSPSTTPTRSPSRTTPTSPSARMSPPASPRTAGMCRPWTGPGRATTSRTSTPCSPRSRRRRRSGPGPR